MSRSPAFPDGTGHGASVTGDLTELRRRVDAIVWHHTMDLGHGIVTDGFSKTFLSASELPAFPGATVLDIGAWDGYYSFLAERSGAAHVVALDHYAWGVDFARRNPYWEECFTSGTLPDHSLDTTEFWDPSLAGMAGFNLAREVLDSKVEAIVDDFAAMDLSALGQFDVVLFLGVLYHLKEPLAALERLHQVTGRVAVIETEALALPGQEESSLIEFTAGLLGPGHDYGNWYTPTLTALHQMCRAAGFSRTVTVVGPPATGEPHHEPAPSDRWRRAVGSRLGTRLVPPPAPPTPGHYRAVIHAYR
jgi:tRNA (mo5U34)-methyltransferase